MYTRAVVSSIIGGGGVNIHIYMFTHHKNNRFQKKLIVQNTNIWISAPPPNYRACYGPVYEYSGIGSRAIVNDALHEVKNMRVFTHGSYSAYRIIFNFINDQTSRSQFTKFRYEFIIFHFQKLNI